MIPIVTIYIILNKTCFLVIRLFLCSNPSWINGTIDTMRTIIYLNNIGTLISRYLGTSLYIFGLIGALLNMYVFWQSSLRSNTCCVFLLAFNIVDFLHINNSLLVRIAQHGFHWDPTVFFPFVCRMRYYITYVLITLYVPLITLASCERYASTCKRRSHWRRFSTSTTAFYTILSCSLIYCFVCLFVFPCYGINQTSLCAVHKDVCTAFTLVYTFVVIGFVPPVFTSIFAWLTLRSLRILHCRARTAPISYKTYLHIKQANEQLTSMLLVQIIAMLVSSVPYASFMIYTLSTHYVQKMPLQIAWEQLITHFIHLLTYVNYVCSAYIYLATSSMYRQYLMSANTHFREQFEPAAETFTSEFLSLSRAENATMVLFMPAHTSEANGRQQHHSRAVSFPMTLSQGDPFNAVHTMINTLESDSV